MAPPSNSPNPPAPRLVDEAELPRLPRQARSQAKRRALLDAALRLFAARGYEAVGIEEIAGTARTGVGSVYAYFRGKQQLLLVLMQEYLAAMQALDLRAPFAAEHPLLAIEWALRRALVPDRAYAGLWRAWREAVLTHEELRPLDRAIADWMRDGVATLIEAARPSGRLRPDLDVSATATVINATAWQLSQSGGEDETTVIAAAARMIYHAIFADERETPV
jgi:AcrR family transcriptional regulator